MPVSRAQKHQRRSEKRVPRVTSMATRPEALRRPRPTDEAAVKTHRANNARDFEQMFPFNEKLLKNIRVDQLRLSQGQLVRGVGPYLEKYARAGDKQKVITSHAIVSNWETGRQMPKIDQVWALAHFFSDALGKIVTPQMLAFSVEHERVVPPNPEQLGYALVPEVLFLETSGARKNGRTWGLPVDWLRSEMRISQYDKLFIYAVQEQSGPYEYGDRVVIDETVTEPTTSPAYFLFHWHGKALISKISVPFSTDKKVMATIVVEAGGKETSHEIEVSKLQIVGRVRGVWRKT